MEIGRYLELFKLRICSLITFSAIVGLVAASSPGATLGTALFLVAATMLAAAAASAFNHYFDSDIDSVMKRTRKRPFPSGAVAGSKGVLVAAAGLFLLSIAISVAALNYMVAVHLALGAFVYAVVYTVWLKRRSSLNIIIGGLAGSFAVLAGGASASPELCAPPMLLAVVMFFWTPSHFWSFAICHREEYERAGVPMLPVRVGDSRTALYIFINTVLLVISSLSLWFFGNSGPVYLAAALALGAYFIYWNIRLLLSPEKEVARSNFRASMVYLGALFTSVVVDMAIRNV
ncbi:MAG: heme o synthase [Thermodesulfobacteriota bacterium]|nr:MAG: heme o synthase [Thermodesulfobacteriota bacterium]